MLVLCNYPRTADYFNDLEISIAAKEARINENSENWEKASAAMRWKLILRRNYINFNSKNPEVAKESEEDSWAIVLKDK